MMIQVASYMIFIFNYEGCKYHVDCHLDRPFEVETFLNMVSVAGLHKLGYTYQDGKIIRYAMYIHRYIYGVPIYMTMFLIKNSI